MSDEKVGGLYAELRIEDLSERQLDAAQQNLESFARRAAQIPDPRVDVDTQRIGPELDRVHHELRSVADQDYTVTPDVDVSHVDDGADEGRSRLGSMVSDWGSTLVMAAGVIGAAAGSKLVDEFMDWADKDKETDRLAAALGLNDWASARYGRLAGEIYGNAWGDSFADVTGALQSGANNQLFDFEATDAEISTLTERLIDLSSIFGQDLPAMSAAAGALIRNGMAHDVWEAMDILTAGFQKGLDRNGDFLDSFTEYPALFQALGIQGPAALGMIDQLLGSGARNTDLAADALKEFTIRSKDGSEATSDAMKLLGLDAEDVAARLATGGDDAADAFDTVLDRIRDIEDPVKRSKVQVALFGTQAEDLQTALDALDPSSATDAIGDVAGKAEEASDRVNDNFATSLEGMQRRTKASIENYLGSLWTAYDEGGFTGLTDKLGEDVDKLAAWWDENGDRVTDAFGEWWSEKGLPILSDLLGQAGEIIGESLWAAFDATMDRAGDGVAIAFDVVWQQVKDGVDAAGGIIWDGISNGFVDMINDIIDAWNDLDFTVPAVEVLGQKVGGQTIGTPDIEHLPHFATGGPVLAPPGSPVLAVVHGGEHVQTADDKASQDDYIRRLERRAERQSQAPDRTGHTTNIWTTNPERYVRDSPWRKTA